MGFSIDPAYHLWQIVGVGETFRPQNTHNPAFDDPKMTSFANKSDVFNLRNDPAIYQIVLDGLETGVYIVDRSRRIRFWNEGAEQITGYLRQDVVGRLLRDHLLITRDDAKDIDSDPDDPIRIAFNRNSVS